MRHFPVLRAGQPYRSVEPLAVQHFLSGEELGEISQANAGMVAWDLRAAADWQAKLQALSVTELVDIFRRAADAFDRESLSIGDWHQSFDDYLFNLSSTTGMPLTLCRKNASKISNAMREMEPTLRGLMRGLDLSVLDNAAVRTDSGLLSFRREADSLGAVLPSNSPGVHTLWLPALALKIPVVLKPGRQEPWSPYRIAAALLDAGLPAEAISIYPTDHAGARELLLRCGRSMLFGDERTVAPWKADHRVQIHGPGWSKLLVGSDVADELDQHLDLMQGSICENSGRSCLNASSIWFSRRGRETAEKLAQRMAAIVARPLDDPEAALSAFSQPQVAHLFSQMVDQYLAVPGAEDLTAKYRDGGRVVEVDGATFLLPTLVWCDQPDHPLMQMEFLFPFAAATQVKQEHMLDAIGETLVATALTRDASWIGQLQDSSRIDRLNIGPIATFHIRRDQPHEGNLFEFMFRQRAYQEATWEGGYGAV